MSWTKKVINERMVGSEALILYWHNFKSTVPKVSDHRWKTEEWKTPSDTKTFRFSFWETSRRPKICFCLLRDHFSFPRMDRCRWNRSKASYRNKNTVCCSVIQRTDGKSNSNQRERFSGSQWEFMTSCKIWTQNTPCWANPNYCINEWQYWEPQR